MMIFSRASFQVHETFGEIAHGDFIADIRSLAAMAY
jgi:hypothetical protein